MFTGPHEASEQIDPTFPLHRVLTLKGSPSQKAGPGQSEATFHFDGPGRPSAGRVLRAARYAGGSSPGARHDAARACCQQPSGVSLRHLMALMAIHLPVLQYVQLNLLLELWT